MKKIFGLAGGFFAVLAIIQALFLYTLKAHHDYGWLGVVVLYSVGLALAPLAPFAGWWLFPREQMTWLWVFIIMAFCLYFARSDAKAWQRIAALVAGLIFSLLAIASISSIGELRR